MSNFTIDVNIKAPELEKALNSLADLLAVLPHILHREIAVEAAAQLAGQAVEASPEKPSKEEEQTPETVQVETKLTVEDVRAAFMAKNSKGNTKKLKTILDEFGVARVTDLAEKDFPEVLKALEEL